ncbi:MAG: hypothetical protein PHT62_10645 [Desulfotomaculaceae bacterium]|nr:hypothetical protein [Desulfotomaculaceae bacterium]
MFRFNPFKKKKPVKKPVKTAHAEDARNGQIENQLKIALGGILLKINRRSTFPPTNELSAIIPRAEIRRRYYSNGRLTAEEEIILNSITLVDSPHHLGETSGPPASPAPSSPRLPETP